MWYYYQPKEFVHASLMENALLTLNINRNKLKIKNEYENSYGTMGIYSLADKDARASAKRILEEEGNKNIKITSSYLATLDGGDTGYKVSYECLKLYNYVNVEDEIIKYKTNKK